MDNIKTLEKEDLFKDDHLMFCEDGKQIKRRLSLSQQEKTNLVLLSGDNLVRLCTLKTEADRDKKWTRIAKAPGEKFIIFPN